MRENQKLDDGSIKIHKKVLADIVISVIHEIEGISLTRQSAFSKVVRYLSKKFYSGVNVSIDKDNDVSIAVDVCVRYGVNIPDISRQLQDAVREMIEKTTNINLKDIHINIQEIEGGAG